MKYQDNVISEVKLLSKVLESYFKDKNLWFVSASPSRIKYGINSDTFEFCYSDDRYDYGGMNLRGILFKSPQVKKEVEIQSILSFVRNNNTKIDENYSLLGREEAINQLKEFYTDIYEDIEAKSSEYFEFLDKVNPYK